MGIFFYRFDGCRLDYGELLSEEPTDRLCGSDDRGMILRLGLGTRCSTYP